MALSSRKPTSLKYLQVPHNQSLSLSHNSSQQDYNKPAINEAARLWKVPGLHWRQYRGIAASVEVFKIHETQLNRGLPLSLANITQLQQAGRLQRLRLSQARRYPSTAVQCETSSKDSPSKCLWPGVNDGLMRIQSRSLGQGEAPRLHLWRDKQGCERAKLNSQKQNDRRTQRQRQRQQQTPMQMQMPMPMRHQSRKQTRRHGKLGNPHNPLNQPNGRSVLDVIMERNRIACKKNLSWLVRSQKASIKNKSFATKSNDVSFLTTSVIEEHTPQVEMNNKAELKQPAPVEAPNIALFLPSMEFHVSVSKKFIF